MAGKLIDSEKQARHAIIEDAMNDVISQHTGAPIGPVGTQEIAALHRKIGVESNMRGAAFTPGELITAAGIVMEETGAKPMYNAQMMADAEGTMKSRVHKKNTSFFFFGKLNK